MLAYFEQLKRSEYFLFIDFNREKLDNGHRGSLFCHQELAIASFLDIPWILFQEKGLKREGVLGIVQGNARLFAERRQLARQVVDEIKNQGWDPSWRNELVLRREPSQSRQVRGEQDGKQYLYFHIAVVNRHRSQIARNCYAYLERITLPDGRELRLPFMIALKWGGSRLPNAQIRPRDSQEFDAMHIPLEEEPLSLRWEDVHLDEGWLLVRAENTKAKRDDVIPLDDVTVKHLRKIVHFGVHVFQWPFTETQLTRHFHRLQKKAGLDSRYGFHSLKKACVTNNASRLSPSELNAFARHASMETTRKHYTSQQKLLAGITEKTYRPTFLETQQ